ncbi:iron-siderophore ABC transporter substrate-binding protein [Roseomonas sp. ACRSG]|nr:iron-siderophore ABC transporter substrate-binding protein [Roseomonas sp. ACRSG]
MTVHRLDLARQASQRTISRRAALAALATCTAASPALAEEVVRIPHVFGETVLRQPPRRVVSLGYTAHDALLALDVQPVAVRRWFGDQASTIWPWAQPYQKGPQPVVLAGEVSVERVATLEPDLIVGIGSGISHAEYEALSAIAPVLMQAQEQAFSTSWDNVLRMLGLALNKREKAESLIAHTRQQFAAVRERHPAWTGRTAVAAYNFSGETGAFTSNDTRGRFLTELGFVVPAALDRLGGRQGFYAKLSPEDLSPLDADLLIWVSSAGTVPDIVALPMRRFLRAHLEGREVLTSPLLAAALSFGSVLSLPFALAALEPEIAAAMDGDPSTPVASAVQAGLAR